MARTIVDTPDAPGAGGRAPYSQATKAAGLIFVSGQGPFDPETGDVVGEAIEEQTRQCLVNVEAILRAGGSSLDRVVQATIILREPEDFAGMNAEWSRWFPEHPPARQGAKIPIDSIRISIAVIAEA